MSLGLVTGLFAAVAWGTLDLLIAVATRRVGSLRVTAGLQLVGAVLVIATVVITGTTLVTDPFVVVGGALVGLAGAGAYLSYFTGLRIGPIAVVSGVVAAYGGLTVVMAVVLRGETLSPLQALGALLSTVGVVLTGITFDQGSRARFASPGVIFAIVALVLFASMSIGADIVIDRAPWLSVLAWTRTSNAILSIVILVIASTVLRRQAGPLMAIDPTATGRAGTRVIAAVATAGTLDILGLMAFSYGLEHAETWLVGLASSFGPAVTIVAAVGLMGERLRAIQWAGIAAILAGLVAIAVS
jgi:drug/metabolite transporter (DMT)-like permease